MKRYGSPYRDSTRPLFEDMLACSGFDEEFDEFIVIRLRCLGIYTMSCLRVLLGPENKVLASHDHYSLSNLPPYVCCRCRHIYGSLPTDPHI